MPRDNPNAVPGVIYTNGAYHARAATVRIAHQTSIMVIRALVEQFAEQIHPNMLKDCRVALDANEAALAQEPPGIDKAFRA